MENLEKEAYVSCYLGEDNVLVPLADYLDMEAEYYGFDCYEELKKAGYFIDMPDLVDENGNPL